MVLAKRRRKKAGNSIVRRPCDETVSANFIEAIHEHLVRAFMDDSDPISPPGVRDRGLLESAVSRQHVGFGAYDKYPTAILNAASLMYGLCNDHPFHNGNKRTALIAGIMHLDRNNIVLNDASSADLEQLMKRIAAKEMSKRGGGASRTRPSADAEVEATANWIAAHARKIQRGERTITYRQLLDTIGRFEGIRVDDKGFQVHFLVRTKSRISGRTVWKRRYTLPNPGDHRDVSVGKIKEIRSALNLTEKDGVDSVAFYDEQTSIDEFITQHRRVLRRLART